MNIVCKTMSVSKNLLEYEDSRDKMVLAPVSHFIQTVPADIWEEFSKAFNYWLNVQSGVFKEVAKYFRYFYYSDRLFEAMQDNSPAPISAESSCISVHGESCTLNSLFLIHLIAAKNLAQLNLSMAPALYLTQIEEVCIARYMEQDWNGNVICPTEAEYYHMIVKQTSGHFGAQIKFLQLYSLNQNNFRTLSAIFGLFLHILEDYRYFISGNESESKIYLPDETLARFNLPLIHAIKNNAVDGHKIMLLLRQRTNNKELKIYVVQLLEKIGSLEYTRKTLTKLREEALLEMGKFEKNPLLEKMFDKYFNIPLPSHTLVAENSVDSTEATSEIIKIASFLNQMENVQFDENVKKILLKPFNHLDELGKRTNIVHVMLGMLNETVNAPDDKCDIVTDFVCVFTYAYLMIDDIQDKSILRKGVPCAHLIYGVMNTMNSVYYAFAKSLKLLLTLDDAQAADLYCTYILKSFKGQGMELYWRDSYVCPTEEEYTQMVAEKTGDLLRLILSVMPLCGTSTIDVEKLAYTGSVYFQIHDDYENLIGQEYYESKGFCEDITEGKFGFPTVHAINTHPNEAKKLIDILRQRTYDIEVKKSYLSVLEKCGSFKYTREKLKEYRKQLIDAIEPLHCKDIIEVFIRETYHISLEEDQTDKR